jgi:hypothetical protein
VGQHSIARFVARQHRNEQALCDAYTRMPAALPKVPEPRHQFTNATRRDTPTHPWRHVVDPAATCARAAVATGDRAVMLATRQHIVAAFQVMLGHALAAFPADLVSTCLTERVLAFNKEASEAVAAGIIAHHTPTIPNLERLLRETADARDACETLDTVTLAHLTRQPVRINASGGR